VSNDKVLDGISPEPALSQITKEMRVDNLELSSKHTAGVDVGGVGLNARM
jgi:hypothetical protein